MSSAREQILDILKNADGNFVSSSEICDKLHTSRTAVWKHIHILQTQGYRVEAVTHKGYRLSTGDLNFVTSHEIQSFLRSQVFGKNIVYKESVDSTNTVARAMAEEGAVEGTLVIADEQTHGRGRFHRPWVSPPKSGILMSIIVRPTLSIAEAPKLTSLAAVAVAKYLIEWSSLPLEIKWPNDILFNGKKLCGILTEVNTEGDLIKYAIIGVGINANAELRMYPDRLQPTISSLEEMVGRPVNRAEIVAGILSTFEFLYRSFAKNGDFSEILNFLRAHSATLGRYVEVDSGVVKVSGMAEEIAEDGALIVRISDRQRKKLYSGDIIASQIGKRE